MIWQLLARAGRVFPREGCESRCVTTLNTITAAAIVPATLNHGVVGHRRMLSRRAINDAPAASIRFLLPSALIETVCVLKLSEQCALPLPLTGQSI